MGESREGEGRSLEEATTVITQALIDDYAADNVILDRIQVTFVTEGLYAVEVLERGQNDTERFFLYA